ncbi:MAG: outer membrane protein assembly factor BamE [Alphaproteobacteria bacterium]
MNEAKAKPPRQGTNAVLRSTRVLTCAGVALSALTLAGCEPMIHTDGIIPDPIKLASIQPGQQSEDDVRKLIGSPASVSMFGEETWYYISKRTRTVAFFEPDILDQKVVEISFDQAGLVNGMRQYTVTDANDISPVGRTTPTKGKVLTIWDQMLGNLNRYAPPPK